MPKQNQPSKAPIAKVTAGGVAGAATVLAVFIANQAGMDVTPEVASAFTTVVTFAVSYFVPSSYGKGDDA